MTITSISPLTLLGILCCSFLAGFVDGIVGGGGLIQLPALLIGLPTVPIPTLLGTNKIAAFSGTLVAAYRYAMRVKFDFSLLGVISLTSFASSFMGARMVSHLPASKFRIVILALLVFIALYTFLKKDLGNISREKMVSRKNQFFLGIFIGLFIGFYDGFFGPGTGSFLVLGFVTLLGLEFFVASAYAKIVNCVTNLSALCVFVWNGNYLLSLAVPMLVLNIVGNLIGSHLAIQRGNSFIRKAFLVVVMLMILRYSYDIF